MTLDQDFVNTEPQKLRLEGVTKRFTTPRSSVHVLEAVDLEIGQGEFVCLLGPSGCGKSTILNMIAGFERPDSGRVLVDGHEVKGPGRDRMVMFQEHALFPWLDVLGNVLFGLELKHGVSRKSRHAVAGFYLDLVGLKEARRQHVHELSGGMKQRVALARALAPNPPILLMDEPFASLDTLTCEQLYADLQRIWQARKKTVAFVTHNVREAVVLGDRVIVFATNPGRPIADVRIELPRPRDVNSFEVARLATQIVDTLREDTVPAPPAAPALARAEGRP
jgi:NitT/TauT family transport system ATP-binding protein